MPGFERVTRPYFDQVTLQHTLTLFTCCKIYTRMSVYYVSRFMFIARTVTVLFFLQVNSMQVLVYSRCVGEGYLLYTHAANVKCSFTVNS